MGFFNIVEDTRSRREIALSSSSVGKLGCKACPLDKEKSLRSPKMEPAGAEQPLIYFIGEAPTEKDDDNSEHFSGFVGEAIRSRIPSRYKKLIRWNNVVRCHTKNVGDVEVECCRKLQVDDITKTRPKVVVGFGTAALNWFADRGNLVDLWRGKRLACSVGDHKFWFYPMLSPVDVHRRGGNSYRGREWMEEFQHDLSRIFKDLDEGIADSEPDIYTEEDLKKDLMVWKPGDSVQEWCDAILEVCNGETVGHDIETTGLNSYAEGARVLTSSFSSEKYTIAYPISHPEAGFGPIEIGKLKIATRKGLLSAKRVIAHNSPFEQEWWAGQLKDGFAAMMQIKWECSLAQAYVLDERNFKKKSTQGLEDQMLINFGVRNMKSMYSLDMANLINEPLSEVLPYNSVDAKACRMVWKANMALLKHDGLYEVYRQRNRLQTSSALLMRQGLVPDLDVAKALNKEFSGRIKELEKNLEEMDEVKQYKKSHGSFNPNTPDDILGVLNEVLEMGVGDTGEETLEAIKHPFAKSVLERRQISTLHTRYVVPIHSGELIQPDGRIHFRHSFTRTSTGRSASEDPNSQNFPKRKHRRVRGVIGAPPNHYMASFDYGQIEARIFPMASKDRRLIDEMWTDYDIHSFWLERITKAYPKWKKCPLEKLSDPKIRKYGRDCIKNEWTFPQFFGAMLSSVSGYLGIPEDVLEEANNEFWGRYSGVKKWQEGTIADFKRNRYVQTLNGFRRRWGKGNPLSPNEAINMGIQGTANEIKADAMYRCQLLAVEREEPWLASVLDVHDDLTFYIPKGPHAEPALELIGKTMCLSPFEFINVPLVVELSIGDNWYEQEEIHKFNSKDYGVKRAA